MAKVTIQVEDRFDGSVDLAVVFDPVIESLENWEELTKAQKIGHNFLDVLNNMRPMTQDPELEDIVPEQANLLFEEPFPESDLEADTE